MIQPIKIQALLDEKFKLSEGLMQSIFIATLDGSCLACVPNLGLKEQALQINYSILFDDCQEIGRIKLSNQECIEYRIYNLQLLEEQGSLNYAFVEHDNGIALIANIKHYFVMVITAKSDVKMGILINEMEKLKRLIENELEEKVY